MAKVVVLGAGVSGHTATSYLWKGLKPKNGKHEVVVVSPNSNYQWVPSNIWVGVGRMKSEKMIFPLAPVYKKKGVTFLQAKALTFHPEGDSEINKGYITIEYVAGEKKGQREKIDYDFLVNGTGPKLRFDKTPGLSPGKNKVYSVCSYTHAEEAWEALEKLFHTLKKGERKKKILIGTGHSLSTCQGAAFEYILNVDFEIKRRNLQDYVELTWISNEYELGDFGMGGAFIKKGGYITSTKIFTTSYFTQRGINWIKRAGVTKIEDGVAHYETLAGDYKTESFDFAMLLPAFSGQDFKAYDKTGKDISEKLFADSGFMKVDADYSGKPYEEWSIADWPSTYQSQAYPNLFAPGIAFAPPHSISKPLVSKNGNKIYPSPPRTGMPSGVSGKIVAQNIVQWIKGGKPLMKHKASMGKMGAACIVSAGYGMRKGTAATMTVNPIVPDWEKYPQWGRELKTTMGEPGLAGHWLKIAMHHMFLYKAKAKPFWSFIPE